MSFDIAISLPRAPSIPEIEQQMRFTGWPDESTGRTD